MRLNSPVSGYTPTYKAAPQFTGRKKQEELDPISRTFLELLEEEKAAEKAAKKANSTRHLLGEAAKKFVLTKLLHKEYTPPKKPTQTIIAFEQHNDQR